MGSRVATKKKGAPPANGTAAPISVEQARAVLQNQQKERVKACVDALPGFLASYGCELVPQVLIHGGKIHQAVIVVLAEEPAEHHQTSSEAKQ